MKLLSGGVASLFGQLLGSSYLAGRIWMGATTYAPDGRLTRARSVYEIRVQVDAATERMVQNEGYTATDRALYVLRASYDGPLNSDCEVAVDEGPYAGTRWRVASPIESDPGAAYWLCRGVLAGEALGTVGEAIPATGDDW